jgi:transposase
MTFIEDPSKRLEKNSPREETPTHEEKINTTISTAILLARLLKSFSSSQDICDFPFIQSLYKQSLNY